MPLWMLGSRHDSPVLAARRGLPYNLGLFINPQADSRHQADEIMVVTYMYYFEDRKRSFELLMNVMGND